MTAAQYVIEKFGSLGKLAAALGHNSRSTVQGWRKIGRIPSKHQAAVLIAANKAGISLSASDVILGPSVKTNGAAKKRKR